MAAVIKANKGYSPEPITAQALTLEFHYFTISRYQAIVPNAFIDNHEWDLCGVRKSGFIDEVEIKLTRSDFLADFKKMSSIRAPLPCSTSPERGWTHWKYIPVPKHEKTGNGQRCCNYFWYLMPEDLANKCLNDMPEYCGVIAAYYDNAGRLQLKQIRAAKRIHRDKKGTKDFVSNIRRLCALRYWDIAHRVKHL